MSWPHPYLLLLEIWGPSKCGPSLWQELRFGQAELVALLLEPTNGTPRNVSGAQLLSSFRVSYCKSGCLMR